MYVSELCAFLKFCAASIEDRCYEEVIYSTEAQGITLSNVYPFPIYTVLNESTTKTNLLLLVLSQMCQDKT